MTGPASGIKISGRASRSINGFSLTELLTAIAIISVLSALAIPVARSFYVGCCLKATIFELCDMFKEAKQKGLSEESYLAITFNTTDGVISLVSGRGPDGRWNTPDDPVVRSIILSAKGGGIRFGHGSYGPIKGLAAAPDGVSFTSNNTCVCNPDLTGNAGAVYLMSASGAAMALTMNSRDFGYKMYRWDGKEWVRM